MRRSGMRPIPDSPFLITCPIGDRPHDHHLPSWAVSEASGYVPFRHGRCGAWRLGESGVQMPPNMRGFVSFVNERADESQISRAWGQSRVSSAGAGAEPLRGSTPQPRGDAPTRP